MRYLVDTCALIWWFNDSPRLSKKAASALNAKGSHLSISPISAYEMALKFGMGKLDCAENLLEGLDYALRGSDMVERLAPLFEVPIITADTRHAAEIKSKHRDPFDRIIAAQAIRNQLTIITSDHFFKEIGVPVLW